MSLPTFPILDPPLSREDAINQIISSIAMEELALSHIMNAEGEKLQYVLGTIPGITGPQPTIEEVLKVNESIRGVLQSAADNQSLLRNKLQTALSSGVLTGPTGATGATGPQGPATIDVIEEVENLEPNELPYVINTGDKINAMLQFGIPRGATGATGAAATVKVGEVLPVAYSDTYVTNVGTEQNAVLNFGIPVGPAGAPGATGATGATGPIAATIPFSLSGYGAELGADEQGDPFIIAFAGFGPSNYTYHYLEPGEWNTGTITVREDMYFDTSFILPHNGLLKKIYVMFSTREPVTFNDGSVVRPFACLAVSNADNLVYTILRETMTFAEPYLGGIEYPKHAVRKGSLTTLNTEIAEGTLVGIVVGIKVENITEELSAPFSVGGGLYIE